MKRTIQGRIIDLLLVVAVGVIAGSFVARRSIDGAAERLATPGTHSDSPGSTSRNLEVSSDGEQPSPISQDHTRLAEWQSLGRPAQSRRQPVVSRGAGGPPALSVKETVGEPPAPRFLGSVPIETAGPGVSLLPPDGRSDLSHSGSGSADAAAHSPLVVQASHETPALVAGQPESGASEPARVPPRQFARRGLDLPVTAAPGVNQPPDEQMLRGQQPPFQPEREDVLTFFGNVEVLGFDQLGVLLVRGAPQDVEDFLQIIEKIQEIAEGVEPRVRVFQLHRASATTVRDTVLELYGGAAGRAAVGGGGGQAVGQQAGAAQVPALKRFQIAANERSNTLSVLASPQMLEELAKLIERLDVDTAPTANVVRVFQLRNAQATEVTDIINEAVSGTAAAQAAGAGVPAGVGAGGAAAGREATIAGRSSVLKLVLVNGESRTIESGILDEVRVTAQVRTNSVVVTAPESSMELLAAIIAELDKPPTFVAATKVFALKNSDATNMRNTLAELFDLESTAGAGGVGAGAAGTTTAEYQRPIAVAAGDHPPISVRVAVDARTNSLIVSGPENTLLVLEAVVRKLDLSDLVLDPTVNYNRKSTVYRLKNAQASDVALALTNFYSSKRTIESQQAAAAGQQQTLVGAYQRFEQDVVVEALDNTLAAALTTSQAGANSPAPTANVNSQGVSNLLLISASPRYYDQVIKMIQELDAPQPQVIIQVIIAQLRLSDNFEFGVELGFQSDVLFNRGDLAANPLSPGFNFNNTGALPNSTVVHPSRVGGSGLSNLNLGRANMDGIGGLILSASSDSISALVRALQTNNRLEIISRPQIMTLDGRTARVSVVDSIPYVGQVTQTQIAVTTPVSFINVGVTLTVKPSITPDDRIYLEVVPEVSQLEQLVTFASGATTLVAPRTSLTATNTVVSVNDGQTIVLGGLIQNSNIDTERKVPWLGDLPLLGNLFRFTQHQNARQELIVILTPHIVRNEADAQRIKDQEVERVNWILCNTPTMHGDLGLTPTADESGAAPVPCCPPTGANQQPVIFPTSGAEDPMPTGASPGGGTPGGRSSVERLTPQPVRGSGSESGRKSRGDGVRRFLGKS